jgi:hypothetical protein
MAIVKAGYYEDGNAFASSLIHQTTTALANIPNMSGKIQVRRTQRSYSDAGTNLDSIVLIISPDLQEFLGFRRKLITMIDLDRDGPVPSDVNRGLNLVYVCCDTAADSTVCDIKAPLLRVCNFSGEHGRVVHDTNVRLHYVPVGRRDFDTVEIAINKVIDESMPIEFGKSVVTLHFRRR